MAKGHAKVTCKRISCLLLVFYFPFQTCTTEKVKLAFCGEWIYQFLPLLKHLLPGFCTWNLSQLKSWSLGCGLMGLMWDPESLSFYMSLTQCPTPGLAKMKSFCPAWLYASFWQCVVRSERNKNSMKLTHTHTIYINRCFYSLWYHFSFPIARYSLELLIKGLKTQNIFSFPPTSTCSKKEISYSASFKWKSEQYLHTKSANVWPHLPWPTGLKLICGITNSL